MARIYQTGFESNSLVTGVEFTYWHGTGNTGSIDSSIVHGGSYSYRNNPSASIQYMTFAPFRGVSGNISTSYVRFYYYVTTHPANTTMIFGAYDITSSRKYVVRGTGSGIRLLDNVGTQCGSDISLSTGKWYCIEIKVVCSTTVGTLELRVDGNVVASGTGFNTGTEISNFIFGTTASASHDYYIDDFAWNDTTGAYQNSWCGEGRIVHLKPDSSGDINTFSTAVGGTAGSSNNFTRVSENTPDDATSYNASNTTGEEDLFNFEASSLPSDAIIKVLAVGIRSANITASDLVTSFKAEIMKVAGGTKQLSTYTYVPSSTTWQTNDSPQESKYRFITYVTPDGEPWTTSTINSMQIGYKLITPNVNPIAVSTVWASIEYATKIPHKIFSPKQAIKRSSTY